MCSMNMIRCREHLTCISTDVRCVSSMCSEHRKGSLCHVCVGDVILCSRILFLCVVMREDVTSSSAALSVALAVPPRCLLREFHVPWTKYGPPGYTVQHSIGIFLRSGVAPLHTLITVTSISYVRYVYSSQNAV